MTLDHDSCGFRPQGECELRSNEGVLLLLLYDFIDVKNMALTSSIFKGEGTAVTN